MENLPTFVSEYLSYVLNLFSSPANPDTRLFAGFLLSALVFAYALYLRRAKGTGFLKFLFPKSVWSHPSAWLDVRYFFFHSLTGKFFALALGTTAFGLALFGGVSLAGDIGMLEAVAPDNGALRLGFALTAMIIVLLASDFIAFYIHYLQHKNPVLWQFHKVHHSGEVMHPLSNYREHPIDNLTYDVSLKLFVGFIFGLLTAALGYKPTIPNILGLSIFGLIFNTAAYSLRHSHIWLRWPGHWAKVIGSPAHHQVHHSRHPDHIDKNFAFMLPVWDILFKTYVMPDDNRDVEFGIVEDSSELNSCLNLYTVPFRDAYRVLKTGKKVESPGPLDETQLASAADGPMVAE